MTGHVGLIALTLLVAVSSGAARSAQPHRFDVIEATIEQIHAALRNKRLTCRQLVDLHLDRIAAYDQTTKLNSLLCINPSARTRADELDRLFAQTGTLLPLHGIPVIVKDNYDTFDLPTTAGSLALAGSMPPDDAYQVRRLREAGAVVLAKSNMAEFAHSPNYTISSLGGTTRNPYDLERVPAGSSGGTAAAIAASFGVIGLGTDTGNSIRGPSSHTSLVGLRPTLGLTSRDGIVPLYLRNDIGGPMCRTVADAARVLDVIAGHDPADPITAKSIGKTSGYFESLQIGGLQGIRIGVLTTLSETADRDDEIATLFAKSLDDLRAAGAKIVPGVELPIIKSAQAKLWRNTFRHDLDEYLKSVGEAAPYTTLQAIVDSGRFDDSISTRMRDSLNEIPATDLAAPYSADPSDDPARLALLEAVLQVMDEQRLDALVYPTWNNPPRRIGDLRSPSGNNSFYVPPHTGQPAITVPMGFTSAGLPAGLQILGRPFAEPLLLRLAHGYEQATKHRRPPDLFPTLQHAKPDLN